MKQRIELKETGLKCDNPSCDWVDLNIPSDKYIEYIDKECPKCGQNVLTRDDYEMAMAFLEAVDQVNSMPEGELPGDDGPMVRADVQIHNGLHLHIKKLDDEHDSTDQSEVPS